MKKLILSFAFAIIAMAGSIAQNGVAFEFKLTSDKGLSGNLKANYCPLGTRVEMQASIPNMAAPSFSFISIVKNNKPTTVYTLNEKSKTYSTFETQPQKKEGNGDECTVKVIGKEKVGNYNCTHVIVTKKGKATEYWTSTEIADFEKYSKSNSGSKYMASSDEYDALKKAGAAGFIVKSLTKDEHNGTVIMELVKMEKKELSSSLFEIPSDYKAAGSSSPAGGVAPAIDVEKIKNMTPEEQQKYLEDMKKQYNIQNQSGNK